MAKSPKKFSRGGCVQLGNGKVGFVVRAQCRANSKLVDVYVPSTKRTVSASRITTKRKKCSKTMAAAKRSWEKKHPRRKF